jgi:hypothetical protein
MFIYYVPELYIIMEIPSDDIIGYYLVGFKTKIYHTVKLGEL